MAGLLPGVTIRQTTLYDAASIMVCLAAAFEPYRQSYTPDAFQDTVPTLQGVEQRIRDMIVLVAADDSGEVIGTVAYHVLDSGEGHLRGMAVHPRFQGKGIAERLLSVVESDLRRQGCTRVTLDTTGPLQRAIRFYCRHGFEPTGVVRDFFGMPLFEYAKRLE